MSVMNCIQRIPQQLKEIRDKRTERMASLREYLAVKGTVSEIIFVASGTSYNGAFTCKSFLESTCNLKVGLVYPNIFVNYSTYINPEALYVVISQGGSTKLVYEALLKIKAAGCRNVSITEDVNSPIAKAADIAIEMGSGKEEYLYRTLGYSTTVATIAMLGLQIAHDKKLISDTKLKEILSDYDTLYTSIPVVREMTEKWYDQHKFSLMRRPKAVIAGTGDLWPVAQESDIKLMEMVPMMTRSFELEEMIHGPQNAFDDATSFYIFSRKHQDDDKVNSIARFIKNEIGFCCVIGANTIDHNDLELHIRSQYFSALEYITVMQVLAYRMAIDHGRDLSRGVNASVKNYVNKSV